MGPYEITAQDVMIPSLPMRGSSSREEVNVRDILKRDFLENREILDRYLPYSSVLRMLHDISSVYLRFEPIGSETSFVARPSGEGLSETLGEYRSSKKLLEEAFQRKDHRTFARIAQATTWSQYEAIDLLETIDMALALDMAKLAMDLVRKGQKLFPHHKRIQQVAKVVLPPVVIRTQPRQLQDTELDASYRWFDEHAGEYKGQWVAVRAGILLGSAPTLHTLYEQLGAEKNNPQTIIVKVLS